MTWKVNENPIQLKEFLVFHESSKKGVCGGAAHVQYNKANEGSKTMHRNDI